MNGSAFMTGYLSKEAQPVGQSETPSKLPKILGINEKKLGGMVGNWIGKKYISPTISKTLGDVQDTYKDYKSSLALKQGFENIYSGLKKPISAIGAGVSAIGDAAGSIAPAVREYGSTGVDKLKKYHADVVRQQINAKWKGGLMKYGPAIGGGLGLLLMLLMSRNQQPQQMMGAMPRGWYPNPQLMPAQGAWQRGY